MAGTVEEVEVNEDTRSATSYWCYECSKQVTVESETRGLQVDLVCSECKDGFVELSQFADVEGNGRTRYEGNNNRHSTERTEEGLNFRQVARVLRLFAQAAQSHTEAIHRPAAEEEVERSNPRGSVPNSAASTDDEVPWEDLVSCFSSGDVVDPRSADQQVDASGMFGVESDSESDGEIELEGSNRTDSDAADLGLGWDSFHVEDEEWEEVGSVEPVSADLASNARPEEGSRRSTRRPLSDGRMDRPNLVRMMRNLDWHDVMQSLDDNNFDLGFDLGDDEGDDEDDDDDTYVGDPEDYVDAAGYEILLEHFAETDNTLKGAPPAARAAVEHLPSIFIEQRDVDDGSALCAICKDSISVGELAKQLPCLHHYHGDCILPWLRSRNSCPVCRYELPTDDPDYEEQRKHRVLQP